MKITFKKLLFVVLVLLFGGFVSLSAQTVRKDSAGNYYAVKAVKQVKSTDKQSGTFTDSKGIKWPVYTSVNNKLYYIRRSKTGNDYKVYLKIN